MPYAALPDHRMPYDNDGTLVYQGTTTGGATTHWATGSATLIEWNDVDYGEAGNTFDTRDQTNCVWMFFPEQREITACYIRHDNAAGAIAELRGSNDTTNGLDGTWETASLPGGVPGYTADDSWRSGIKAVSFTGPKKTIRMRCASTGSGTAAWSIIHLYGEAAAGQMAHDLVYINHDDTPGVPFTASEDFGDQPLGTTVVRQFRIKNTSATKTATGINIQCNDPDFAIAEAAGGPWVVTINLASLAPGAESPTYYLRLTTPAPGATLLPRFARIVTVCDAGFFG